MKAPNKWGPLPRCPKRLLTYTLHQRTKAADSYKYLVARVPGDSYTSSAFMTRWGFRFLRPGVAASDSAATSGAPDSTLPGSADASGTGLPGNGDSSGTAGTDGQGGASGGDPKGGGEAGKDEKLKAVGEPEEGAEGVDGADRANASGHAHGESSGGVSETGEMNKSASQELLRKKSTNGADGADKPPSSSDTPAARAIAAAPSLPPFLKGGGNVSEVVTPAVVVTQRAPEATKGSEVVSATPIEGVGYAGAPIEPNPKCRCCIM